MKCRGQNVRLKQEGILSNSGATVTQATKVSVLIVSRLAYFRKSAVSYL